MQESSRLTAARSRPSRGRSEFGDDECSTDSGCSSGGSSGSAEHLSRRGGEERSPRGHCYLDRFQCRGMGTGTRSQERLSQGSSSSDGFGGEGYGKSQRSCSSCVGRSSSQHQHQHQHQTQSPSHSLSPSDAQSSSDSDSTAKRCSTTETIHKALQSLKVSSRQRETKEKKHVKKSPKSILRSPVSYTYVRGLSGLPTHRVPRKSAPQLMLPCSCHNIVGLKEVR